MEKVILKNLKLDEEEVDGISFSLATDQQNKNKTQWDVSIMSLNEKKDQNFIKNDIGYIYQIVLYENQKADVFEAVIGDLKHYVQNQINANQEGIIVKKCAKSEEILNKIFRGRYLQALADGFMRVAESKG